jgi:8-oxo-dGTP pyrophosphatase MutT (NUDIX family)
MTTENQSQLPDKKRLEEQPKRIYIHPTDMQWRPDKWPLEPSEYIEYVRADLLRQPTTSEQERILREALDSIIVRCEEGDKRTDWLPTIQRIAERAIAETSTTSERCEECGHERRYFYEHPDPIASACQWEGRDGKQCGCKCVFPATGAAPEFVPDWRWYDTYLRATGYEDLANRMRAEFKPDVAATGAGEDEPERCGLCGAEFPEDAPFGSKCGCATPPAATAAKETQQTATRMSVLTGYEAALREMNECDKCDLCEDHLPVAAPTNVAEGERHDHDWYNDGDVLRCYDCTATESSAPTTAPAAPQDDVSLRGSVEITVFRGDRVLAVNSRNFSGFCGVGGKVEPGETFEQAARRELKEETGCEALSITFVAGHTLDPIPGDDATIKWYCAGFVVDIGDQEPRQSEPGTTPFWTTKEDMIANSLFPTWYAWWFGVLDRFSLTPSTTVTSEAAIEAAREIVDEVINPAFCGGRTSDYKPLRDFEVEKIAGIISKYVSDTGARHFFCSCGAACTAEEYIEHYFEKGHDQGKSPNIEERRDFDWALRELADGWIDNGQREGPYGFNCNARRVLELITNDARINAIGEASNLMKDGSDGVGSDWSIEEAVAALNKLENS